MRNFFLKGVAALTMGLAMTACTKDFNYEVEEQKASLDNAQQTLGFYIPENQDWVMTTTATATFNVKGLSDDATLYVFSNNPQVERTAIVLASAPMAGTTTTISGFRLPQHVKSLFVGLKQSNGNMIYKYVDVEAGKISASYDFSSPAQARTRSIISEIGDPFTNYTIDQLNEMYKTSAHSDAKTTSEINFNDQNSYQSYGSIKLENETVGFHFWQGARDIYISGTVTLNVDGTNSMNQARIYLLPNSTLNFNMDNFINNLEIYVARNATLNYNAEKLYKQDGGGIIFNRGTLNLQDNFEANQSSIVYNEGTIYGKNITSKPQDSMPSYFYNFGDLVLTGNMILNSSSNFFNEGTVSVAGQTEATQANIWWINKGHYTTNTLVMHPWNDTFYNYCQLIVEDNTHFYNGAFHLMDNSYIQTGTLDVDNFTIHMGNNSGFNCTGNNTWGDQGGQGDGIYNGFKCTGTNSYIRLGGTTTVAGHKKALETTGNVTIAINNIYDKGAGNSGVQPTIQRNEGAIEATFNTLNPTYNSTDCGATWTSTPSTDTPTTETPTIVTPTTENQSWTYAFEDNKTKCDFDLNDVVIQVRESEADDTKLIVKLVAAGCQYDNYVWLGENQITWDGKAEVHDAFGVAHGVMVNTGNNKGVDMPAVETTIDKPEGFDFQNADFKIRPFRINSNPNDEDNATSDYITIVKEGVSTGLWGPLGLAIPAKWKWPKERYTVNYAYPTFTDWGKTSDLTLRADEAGWYENPASGLVYGE